MTMTMFEQLKSETPLKLPPSIPIESIAAASHSNSASRAL
jgi:hypothetical protein